VLPAHELWAAVTVKCFEIFSEALQPPKCLTGLFTCSRDLSSPHRCRDTPIKRSTGSVLQVDTSTPCQLHIPARPHSFHQSYRPQACATCPKIQPVRYHNAVLNRGLTSGPVITYQYTKNTRPQIAANLDTDDILRHILLPLQVCKLPLQLIHSFEIRQICQIHHGVHAEPLKRNQCTRIIFAIPHS